jgi:hypothetical protein
MEYTHICPDAQSVLVVQGPPVELQPAPISHATTATPHSVCNRIVGLLGESARIVSIAMARASRG